MLTGGNTVIKQKICVVRVLVDDIKSKTLQWYGHVQRMEEGRLPKEVMKWSPPGRRKGGRPKLTWAEGIRAVFLNHRTAARYRALAPIIPGRERFFWNLSF